MRNTLFLGNSLIYFNNLPFMVQTLADEAGIRAYCDKFVRGDAYLREFAEKAPDSSEGFRHLGTAFRSVYEAQAPSRRWNTVVLQEQTYNPAGSREDFLAAIDALLGNVLVNGEEIFLYQTWAYKPGCPLYTEDPAIKLGYEEMYLALKEAYTEAAGRFGAGLVPVGDAFFRSTALCPDVELYHPDGLHPSPMGSYLAAVLFAAKLFGLEPMGCAAVEGLDPEHCALMRSVAAEILGS